MSVEIKTDKQAIELKEIKALAHDLQYFELLFNLWSGTKKQLGPIFKNLPLGLDNFSIQGFTSYEQVNLFMDEMMEKVVNGDTKTVTIADVEDDHASVMIQEIMKISPSPVRVEKNSRVVVEEDNEPCYQYILRRTQCSRTLHDIAISL